MLTAGPRRPELALAETVAALASLRVEGAPPERIDALVREGWQQWSQVELVLMEHGVHARLGMIRAEREREEVSE